jgi:hypothetical protein
VEFLTFTLDYFIPFILFFSIFYAILHQLKIFGDPSESSLARKTNLMVALSLSILVVLTNPLRISFSYFLSQLTFTASIFVLGGVFLVFFSAVLVLSGIKKGLLTFIIASGLVILAFSTTGILNYLQISSFPLKGEFSFGIIAILVLIGIFFGIVGWLGKR